MNTLETIRSRMAPLAPVHLDLQDDSHHHAGHAGAASGGGHYVLVIVSPSFATQSRLARQRAVLSQVKDLMQREIHALSITALTPDEFATRSRASE